MPRAPIPRGEVGTLEEAVMNDLFTNKIFLTMLHEGDRYLGALIFEDVAFCHEVFALLKLNRGKQIKAIGSLDFAHTL